MSKYADNEAHDEDSDDAGSENEDGELAGAEEEDMDDDAQIDARICNLLPKKHEMVLRRLGQG